MTNGGDAGRWWENYLVRYLMPSIAAIGILARMFSEFSNVRAVLFFGLPSGQLSAPILILLVLYANLFCYVASFPILCFHVTRSIDYRKYKWRHKWNDGYILSGIFAAMSVLLLVFMEQCFKYYLYLVIAILFSGMQCTRFFNVLCCGQEFKGFNGIRTSLMYAFLFILVKKRGVIHESHSVENTDVRMQVPVNAGKSIIPAKEGPAAKKQETQESRRYRDFSDSYRHMREHGNSAFIFILEFMLAALIYCVLLQHGGNANTALFYVAVLLVVWSFPAAIVHLLAQHLENRFSEIDEQCVDSISSRQ